MHIILTIVVSFYLIGCFQVIRDSLDIYGFFFALFWPFIVIFYGIWTMLVMLKEIFIR